ncbi:MAG: Fic family protein [Betaproteobacteria bacterium]
MAKAQQPPGVYTTLPKGVRAFVPDPLPPKLDWSADIVAAASEASLVLGRLAGQGSGLENPHLLIRPFVRREAVLSSRIEGTQATISEILADEAGAQVNRAPDDLKEVRNYVVALEKGVKLLDELPLSKRLVKDLHRILMKGVRGDSAAPGEFRRVQNWIGGRTPDTARFVPPPPNKIEECIDAWERYLHTRDLPPLIQAALIHYQFEAIHPFLDGNGRVGRLLITLFLIERQVLPSPLLYLSAFFEASRGDYYDLLTGVTEKDDWKSWILYFLRGITSQSQDALSRVERINRLRDDWNRSLTVRLSSNSMKLLDCITANPFITVKGAEEALGVAFTTAQRAIDVLVERKILMQRDDAKRGRVYVAKRLLDILDEPARLTQSEEGHGKKRKRR